MRHLFRQRLRRSVIVNLKDGTAFAGILFDVDPELVIMRNTTATGAGPKGENVPVDGEVLILRGDVSFIQVP